MLKDKNESLGLKEIGYIKFNEILKVITFENRRMDRANKGKQKQKKVAILLVEVQFKIKTSNMCVTKE